VGGMNYVRVREGQADYGAENNPPSANSDQGLANSNQEPVPDR
jgi:hypothetical protein